MLKIRFTRTGKKHQSFFRIIVNDIRRPVKSGYFLEKLGYYDPITKKKSLNKERINYWISRGAKLSNTIHNLLVQEGIIEGKKIAVHKKKKISKNAKTEKAKEIPEKETQKKVEKKEQPKEQPKDKSKEKPKVEPKSKEKPEDEPKKESPEQSK